VSDTGRKTRTYVRAAGTILAWQNLRFYNNSETEYVKFEYTDASNLSQHSANKDGQVFSNTYGDAVERDSMGGNVGVFNAYFTFNEPPEPDNQNAKHLRKLQPKQHESKRCNLRD